MTRKRNTDLATDLFTHRHDPNEWDGAPTPAKIRPSGTSVISCRIPTEEFHALERAAVEVGETISEYVRQAILVRRSQRSHFTTTRNISYGGQYMDQQDDWQSWTTASSAFVPEESNRPLQAVSRSS